MRWNVLGDGLYLPALLSVLITNTGQDHQQFHRNPVLSPRHSIKTNFTMVTVIAQGVMSAKPTLHRKVTLIWLSNMHWTCGALMACWLISDWCKISVLTVLPVTNTRFSHACEASDHQLKCTLALLCIYLLISLIFLLIIWCLCFWVLNQVLVKSKQLFCLRTFPLSSYSGDLWPKNGQNPSLI